MATSLCWKRTHYTRIRLPGEHAVQHERVQVDVKIERPTKALHDDDGAAVTIPNAVGARAAPEEHHDIL